MAPTTQPEGSTLTTDNVTLTITPPVGSSSRDWKLEFDDRATGKKFTRYCRAGLETVFNNLSEDGTYPCHYWNPSGEEINTTTKVYKVYDEENNPCWFYDNDDFERESPDPPTSYLESLEYWTRLDYANDEDADEYRDCIDGMMEEMRQQREQREQGEQGEQEEQDQ